MYTLSSSFFLPPSFGSKGICLFGITVTGSIIISNDPPWALHMLCGGVLVIARIAFGGVISSGSNVLHLNDSSIFAHHENVITDDIAIELKIQKFVDICIISN